METRIDCSVESLSGAADSKFLLARDFEAVYGRISATDSTRVSPVINLRT